MAELIVLFKGCVVVVAGLCGIGVVTAIAVTIAFRRD